MLGALSGILWGGYEPVSYGVAEIPYLSVSVVSARGLKASCCSELGPFRVWFKNLLQD